MTTTTLARSSDTVFEGKRVLVTGGTGSLGKVLVRRLLSGRHGHPASVLVLSRDEAKQYEMRLAFDRLAAASEDVIYHDHRKVLRYRTGDVRDYTTVVQAMRQADVVFHAAALKQVPNCEYFPSEAMATNVGGALNLARAVHELNLPVEAVIGISTDKACHPVNVMGMTKAMQERVFISANLGRPGTRFLCARYGNVLASRGSVVPLFHSQIRAGGPVTITTRAMTRYFLSLDEAVTTVIDTYRLGRAGEIFVPRVPSSRIEMVAECLIGNRDIEIIETGIRPGEKVHEVLIAEDEAERTVVREAYFAIRPALPELDDGVRIVPALRGEYSSRMGFMSAAALREMLRANGLLVEDEPDFGDMAGSSGAPPGQRVASGGVV